MLKTTIVILLYIAGYLGYQYYSNHYSSASKIEDRPLLWAWSLSAALNEINGVDHTIYGGETTTLYQEHNKKMLSEWWLVDSKEQALETINSLGEGQSHHAAFMEEFASLLTASPAEWDEAAKNNDFVRELAKHKDTIKDKGILAWDYARAQWVIGTAYNAGYLTKEEARSLAIPLAIKTQAVFSSWEEMAENYALGRYYWSQNMSKFDEIKAINTQLLNAKDSPWQILEWQLVLEKTP